jgi:hypothetical protein
MHMAPWPDIAGIDSADARARWCGDAALFTTMLARFFDEFGDVSVPAVFNDSQGVTPYIGRMHKLRGGACLPEKSKTPVTAAIMIALRNCQPGSRARYSVFARTRGRYWPGRSIRNAAG